MVFVAEVYQRRDGISNISLRFCTVSSQSCWWFSVLYCGCFDLQIVKLFLLLLVVFFVPHATQTTKVISPVAQCCVFVVGSVPFIGNEDAISQIRFFFIEKNYAEGELTVWK